MKYHQNNDTMSTAIQKVPEVLVYEMVNGNPIYYKGYRAYLDGTKQIEEIMGSSYLQALIGTELIILLSQLLDMDKYRIMSNEIGLRFSKGSWRAADLVIYEKSKLKGVPIENKYLEIAPEVVIEIDTKANLEEISNPLGYYQEKTAQLLNFGVKKVIWIFSDTQRVMIAEGQEDWTITSWKKNVLVMENVSVNIQEIIDTAS